MYLLIDYREQDFIKRLSEFCVIENDILKQVTLNNVEVKLKITNLPIADFIILENIDDINTICLAIERKSIRDLCSSITDGRFREQKARLLDSINDTSKICYLIEGTKHMADKTNTTLSHTIINGSLLNLVFKHKYKLIQTENKLDTFNNIILLYKKIKNQDFIINEVLQSTSENYTVKLIKRSDKIKDNKLLNQLCLIPGVSKKIAEAIINYIIGGVSETNGDVSETNGDVSETNGDVSENTVSIKSLIDIYISLNEEIKCENYFTNVEMPGNGQKMRKIGKALSKKIYEYFCK
jgi:ERCC4-type nuclease